jgi:hypothetical protein
MVYSQRPFIVLTSEFRMEFRTQAIIQDPRADPQLERRVSDIQGLQASKIKAALMEVVGQLPGGSRDVLPEWDQLDPDLLRDLDGLQHDSSREFNRKVSKLFDYLEKFWSAPTPDERLMQLQHLSQMIYMADDETIEKLAEETLYHPDPRFRGVMCYALGRSGRTQYLPRVRPLLKDENSWVRKQASGAVKGLEVLEKRQAPLLTDQVTVIDKANARALGNLLDFVKGTRERFYNENRRYQLLARIRKVLRERLFEQFPADSTERSLVTAIINATNRTTAKNFRKEYLDIFKDSLKTLRDGRTDVEATASLEERLLEIDDEL